MCLKLLFRLRSLSHGQVPAKLINNQIVKKGFRKVAFVINVLETWGALPDGH